jgi:hypothetical protein
VVHSNYLNAHFPVRGTAGLRVELSCAIDCARLFIKLSQWFRKIPTPMQKNNGQA